MFQFIDLPQSLHDQDPTWYVLPVTTMLRVEVGAGTVEAGEYHRSRMERKVDDRVTHHSMRTNIKEVGRITTVSDVSV